MKVFWMIAAGVCIAVAAFFLVRRDFNTAFVVAALGMIFWFLNYRAQMKEVIAAADAENDKGYAYDTKHVMDAPQSHATWMDGHRLGYVSSGKLYVFDFDSANSRTLVAADPALLPAFTRDYKYLYTTAPGATADVPSLLSRTPLRTSSDL